MIGYLLTHFGAPALAGAVFGLAYNFLARKNNPMMWATAGAFIVVVLALVFIR